MSREPYDVERHKAHALDTIGEAFERIADAMPDLREMAAIAAMQTLVVDRRDSAEVVARLAVGYADALMAELDKAPPK